MLKRDKGIGSQTSNLGGFDSVTVFFTLTQRRTKQMNQYGVEINKMRTLNTKANEWSTNARARCWL